MELQPIEIGISSEVLSYASGSSWSELYIILGLVKEKASLKLGGGLSQCYIHAPIMSSQEKLLFKKFMLAFSQQSLHARYFLYWLFYDEYYWIQMGFIGKD